MRKCSLADIRLTIDFCKKKRLNDDERSMMMKTTASIELSVFLRLTKGLKGKQLNKSTEDLKPVLNPILSVMV